MSKLFYLLFGKHLSKYFMSSKGSNLQIIIILKSIHFYKEFVNLEKTKLIS